jgi:hypothetical protein
MFIRQAIVTKYLGPTNFRGSRIKATAAAGSITVDWPHALNIENAHAFAACQLAEKFNWTGQWFGGGMPGDNGYCFVLAEDTEHSNGAAFVIVETLENASR